MEWIKTGKYPSVPVTAVVLDFDGTVSTLREGWETIMEPLMLEMISPETPPSAGLVRKVQDYISESIGIQTIFQMEWLAEQVKEAGESKEPHDAWWYKDLYNQRLLEQVQQRIARLESGACLPESYQIAGSKAFLAELHRKGVKIYIASGTDDVDVKKEVKVLGLDQYVSEIHGAPHREKSCSKEKVIQMLLRKTASDGNGSRLAVIGDGKVEIRLGKEAGARTIGLASDEKRRHGVNELKRAKLIQAGADIITGDFSQPEKLLKFLGY